jgi:hypothetical protein
MSVQGGVLSIAAPAAPPTTLATVVHASGKMSAVVAAFIL